MENYLSYLYNNQCNKHAKDSLCIPVVLALFSHVPMNIDRAVSMPVQAVPWPRLFRTRIQLKSTAEHWVEAKEGGAW